MVSRMRVLPAILAFLAPSPLLASQAPLPDQQAGSAAGQLPQDLTLLTGKKVLVGRMPLCTARSAKFDLAHAGQTAKVVEVRQTQITAVATDDMPPKMRESIENLKKSALLFLQFEDGKKLNTCGPESASQLFPRLSLAPGETIALTSSSPHPVAGPPFKMFIGMRNSHPAGPVFSPDDIPAYLQKPGIKRTMLMRIDVFRNGAPEDCEVEVSSGDPALDRYTCQLVVKRGHFSSATWTNGMVVTGVIRIALTWAYDPDGPWGSLHGDVDVTVNRLPHGLRSPHFEQMALAVDEAGHIQACEADLNRPKSEKSDPQLAKLACAQLMKAYTPRPPIVEGHAVRSVQTALVRFSTERQ